MDVTPATAENVSSVFFVFFAIWEFGGREAMGDV